jgi:hypothetical protein
MKTDDLIIALSREPLRPARFAPTLTVLIAVVLALALVVTLSLAWLRPRADMPSVLLADNYGFLLKFIFTVSVVAAALPIVRDLSVPGRRVKWRSILTAAPFIVIMFLALRELAGLPVSEWPHHIGHASWFDCLWQIPALAIPAFLVLAFAVRRLAPTNLVRTGAYLGLLAGGIGAIGYALHCHDDAVAFVALSYSLAILEMAAIGALIGPRILRWT